MTENYFSSQNVRENMDLAGLTTFGVHALARWYAEAGTVQELDALITEARSHDLPVFVLGGGSNVLFTRGFEGLVVRLVNDRMVKVDENDAFVFVRIDAGRNWSQTVDECLANGWCGIENLALIPGSLGGAVVQNIGAYGMEIAEIVGEVTCWDPAAGQVVRLTNADCDYGYRTSVFKTRRKDLVVLDAVLALRKQFQPVVGYKELAARFKDRQPQLAIEVAETVKAVRRKKLPDPAVVGNAGSFFKNPVVSRIKMVSLLEDCPQIVSYPLGGGRAKLAAGWLIDAAGLKGKRVGDAAVYERQALVIVNCGNATGADIKALADEVVRVVKRRFGVVLEPEPVIV